MTGGVVRNVKARRNALVRQIRSHHKPHNKIKVAGRTFLVTVTAIFLNDSAPSLLTSSSPNAFPDESTT